MFTLKYIALSVTCLALAVTGCKKEEPQPAAATDKPADKPDDKAGAAKAAEPAKAEEPAKAAEPAKPAAPAAVALTDDKAKELEAKIATGKAEDLAAAAPQVFGYLYHAKEKADGSGYEDGQKIKDIATALLNGEKAAIAAGADEAAKKKLLADFAGPIGKALASAKSKVLPDFLAYTPACAILAGSAAAADETANALGNVTNPVHSALLGCLFQSGPQTLNAYFTIVDDAKARTERLAKAVAATKDVVALKDLMGRLVMFETEKGVDALGEALVGKLSPADKDLDVMIGASLLAKCNVKQLADYATRVAGYADPLKGELTTMAADWTKNSADACKAK